MLVYSFGALALANVSGFLYPAYKSLEEGPRDRDRAWLTYWLVLGALSVAEGFGGVVVGLVHSAEVGSKKVG